MASAPTVTTTRKHSAAYYKALLDSSFDAIIVADVKGIIHNVNHAAIEIFGYDSAAGMVGQNVSIFVWSRAPQ